MECGLAPGRVPKHGVRTVAHRLPATGGSNKTLRSVAGVATVPLDSVDETIGSDASMMQVPQLLVDATGA